MDTSFWKIKLFKKFQTKNKINNIQEILENCHIFHSNFQHPFQTCKTLNSISKIPTCKYRDLSPSWWYVVGKVIPPLVIYTTHTKFEFVHFPVCVLHPISGTDK